MKPRSISQIIWLGLIALSLSTTTIGCGISGGESTGGVANILNPGQRSPAPTSCNARVTAVLESDVPGGIAFNQTREVWYGAKEDAEYIIQFGDCPELPSDRFYKTSIWGGLVDPVASSWTLENNFALYIGDADILGAQQVLEPNRKEMNLDVVQWRSVNNRNCQGTATSSATFMPDNGVWKLFLSFDIRIDYDPIKVTPTPTPTPVENAATLNLSKTYNEYLNGNIREGNLNNPFLDAELEDVFSGGYFEQSNDPLNNTNSNNDPEKGIANCTFWM